MLLMGNNNWELLSCTRSVKDDIQEMVLAKIFSMLI